MKMKGRQSGRSDRVLFVDQLLSAIRKSVRDRRIKRVGIVLAGIVVFVTTYSLILPALTLEEDTLSQLPGLYIGDTLSEGYPETATGGASAEKEVPGETGQISKEQQPQMESDEGTGAENDTAIPEPTVTPQAEEDETSAAGISGVSGTETESLAEEPVNSVHKESGEMEQPVNPESEGTEEENDVSSGDAVQIDTSLNSDMSADEKKSSATEEKAESDPEKTASETVNANAQETITDTPTLKSEEQGNTGNNVTAETDVEEVPADFGMSGPLDLFYKGMDYTVHVMGGESARIPETAVLDVREIPQNSSEYYLYASLVSNEVPEEDASIIGNRFFDVSFLVDGQKIEPEAAVNVEITFDQAQQVAADQNLNIIHFKDDARTELLENDPILSEQGMESIRFETGSFSVFGIVGTTIEKTVLASDGLNYRITASYGPETGIPEGAELEVHEITSPISSNDQSALNTDNVSENDSNIDNVKEQNASMPENLPVTGMGNTENFVLTSARSAFSTANLLNMENFTPFDADTENIEEDEISTEDALEDVVTTKENAEDDISIIENTPEENISKTESLPEDYDTSDDDPELTAVTPTDEMDSSIEESNESLYSQYVARTEQALGMEEGGAGYIRLFDIRIVDPNDPAVKYQPVEGATVEVRVELADREAGEALSVVHFPDGSEEGEEVESSTENGENGSVVEFRADGFSVYSIVDAPEPVPVYENVSTLDDIVEDQAYYLAIARSGTNYMTSTSTLNGEKYELKGDTNRAAGENWFFERSGDGKVNIYYLDPDNNKMYLNVDNARNISFSENPQALNIEPTTNAAGTFYIYTVIDNKNYALSVRGNRNFFFEQRNNGINANERVVLTKYRNDPYKLDGKSFGIAYHDDNTTAAAMTAEKTGNSLKGIDMLMRPDMLSNKGILLVAENSDIQEWTFESAGADNYYIKTTVGGAEKYLQINGANVTLVDQANASKITVTPGSDGNSGKWHFTFNGRSLNFDANKFNMANGSGTTTWLNLVEKSPLSDDDFVEYTARKISASDDILSATKKDEHGEIEYDDQGNPVYKENKAQVVIYTRVWNDTTKKYEFYAVDHDGSLVRVYDSGDQINWVGNKVNSALWEFTEYTNQDGTPTYFYELENTAYAGKYLAPQSEGIISDQPIGINLNGRREGYDYTSIVAWDDPAYAYSGLKIVTNEDGTLRVVTCPLDEADDFHFAVITPPVEETTDVDTVDNDDFGISIKMIDFDNRIVAERDSVQTEYLGRRQWDAAHAYEAETGLVSTNLVNGYPTIAAHTQKHGESLSGLFNNMTPANHLFIQSVYNESGYFEYDSTQNFAHLNTVEDAAEDPEKKVGDFTVYNQLGAIGTSTGPTRVHGQFMPYNDISKETGYAHDSSGNVIRNLNDIAGHELPDSDPRKGEPLYSIPQKEANYYFGMELSAVFTQTPDGVDNWGHDIIFEFTGDDDFWFYVDGELVLDLGGVHSAIGGSVNFRTGEVVCNGTTTSLYEVFRQNYAARGLDVSKVDELFVTKIVNGETVHVFNDYTTHEMKMFYMERGGGASNLRMRFNLASVKPGTVELSKKLKGAEHTSNKLIQYPYQIWYQTVEYQMNEDGTYALGEDGNRIIVGYNKPQLLEQPPKNTNLTGKVYAVYKGTKKLIPFRRSMKIGGFTYQNVFLLKAGETAVINFPENTYRYKLVECGVDTAVYDHVYINGAESGNKIFGKPHNNTDGWEYDPETGEEILPTETTTYEGTTRSDFGITYNTTEGRPRVEYTNEVPPDVMRTLSIKKVLYDAEGHLLSDQDAAALKTAFNYRLYLGNEFAEQDSLEPADMYTYYVKGPGPNSKYCKWDKANQEFVPLDVTTFDEFKNLSEDDQRAGTFTTSIYGAISKIPAGYTVEVRDLIVGTKYKIEEPDREIPKGYTRCDGDGYVRTDTDPDYIYYTDGEGVYGQHPYPEEGDAHTAEPISDTIASKTETPQIEICNQEGWGLTAQKEWTDKDFIIHDPIYLAIYLKGTQGEDQGDGQGTGQGEGQGDGQGEGQGTGQGDGQGDAQGEGQGTGQGGSQDNLGDLVEGTVRRLNTGETEVYWFFQDLKIGGEPHSFGEFIVREVVLTNPVVDEDTGVVTSYSSIIPVGEGQSINISGKTYGGIERTESYTVNYVTGKSSGKNENIRTDTVKNSRPGIQIYKTNWDGDKYLSGAVFTLKDSGGSDVGHATYTSDKNGLVTTAYLNKGTFTLSEIRTPIGYVALDQPITITVTTTQPSEYNLTVTSGGNTYYIVLSGPEGFYTTAEATAEDMARIIVKNRTVQELKVVKEGVDGSTRTPLTGVHFALYDQVRDSEGNVRPAYTPKAGYDDLVTKDGGFLEEITMDLGRGTYYLREKAAPSGYKQLSEDLCFTIGGDGTVVINNAEYASWLTRDDSSGPGTVSYQISIENTPLGITVRKTDELGKALTGSKFELCKKNDKENFVPVTGIDGIGEEGLIDLTDKSEMTFTGMVNGIYKLTETGSPPGYNILTEEIYFSVSNGAVTLTKKNGEEKTYSDVSLLDDNTTIAVKNNPAAVLPATGGPGSADLLAAGLLLAEASFFLMLLWRSFRKKA